MDPAFSICNITIQPAQSYNGHGFSVQQVLFLYHFLLNHIRKRQCLYFSLFSIGEVLCTKQFTFAETFIIKSKQSKRYAFRQT